MAAGTRELEHLYRERFAGFVGALRVVVGDAHVAGECVQAAFVSALANADAFRGGSLAAWVWRIAVNRATDAERRDGRCARTGGLLCRARRDVRLSDWIQSQLDRFRGSSEVDMRGAVVVARLRQHDGSVLEIAERTIPATAKAPVLRCAALRPPPPADPVMAPRDPLSFAGSASCTDLSTMAYESTWQDDGSVALLARRPDGADRIELRSGATTWGPASSDGAWALLTLPPGSLPPEATAALVARDATGAIVSTEQVDWRAGPPSGPREAEQTEAAPAP